MSSFRATDQGTPTIDTDAVIDDDCPEMTDEQLKIMRLVLSHRGVRGNSNVSLYYQGMEDERVHSLKSVMSNMNMTLH